MMKKIAKIFICIIVILSFTACSNKKGVTAKEFNDVLNKDGYYISDITSDNLGSVTKKVLIATNKKYQIEFFEYKDNKSAKDAYKTNKAMFKRYKKKSSKQKETNDKDYDFYSLDLKDEYLAIARSKNTLIYTWSNNEYKNKIKKVFKKLNY